MASEIEVRAFLAIRGEEYIIGGGRLLDEDPLSVKGFAEAVESALPGGKVVEVKFTYKLGDRAETVIVGGGDDGC